MRDIELLVLAGLKFGSPERWVYAVPQLDESFFEEERRDVYKLLVKVYNITGLPCSQRSVEISLPSMKDQVKAMEIGSCYNDLTEDPAEADFRMGVYQLRDLYKNKQFNSVIMNALAINSTGLAIDGKFATGLQAAQQYLSKTLQDLTFGDQPGAMEDATMGANDFIASYAKIKSGVKRLIPTYITPIDNIIHGMEPGDLVVVLGYTGEGKTTLCLNIAHNASINGHNLLYATTETVPDRIRRRFISRHSMESQFKTKLPYGGVKHGTLNAAAEDTLREVVQDLETGRRTGKYGAFGLMVPHSLAHLQEHIREAKRLYGKLPECILDYLALIASGAERETLVDLIRSAKRMAVEEDIVLITPWQTSLTAWQQAQKDGFYKKNAMAETTEIIKSADIVISILRDPDQPEQMLAKIIKARDEDEGQVFQLMADPAYSYIGEPRSRYGGVHL